MNHERLAEPVKHLIDGASIGTIVATFLGWLPHIATVLSIIWVAIRIWETDTIKKLVSRFSG